jgi:activator of 2-hydroxyglutaryl-CoA dehydratase
MARVLEVRIDDLESLSEESTKDVTISSTCTVFAESEVISQLSRNTDKRDIIRGIHRSVASRAGALAKRIGLLDDVIMTGGVARNRGVLKALEEELGHKIYTSDLAQYNGALGAALFAYQKSQL